MNTTVLHSSLPIRVLKFGGSSIGVAESIERVVNIVRTTAGKSRPVVVVSALSHVTNTLESLLNNPSGDRTTLLLGLYRRHIQTAEKLLSTTSMRPYRAILGRELGSIVPALRRVTQRVETLFDTEAILAVGERFSVPLISAALRYAGMKSEAVDAVNLVRIEDVDSRRVNPEETAEQIRKWHHSLETDVIPVITGFIGAASCGRTVTLGRGGSDLTAALIAGALNADLMERWTDVDGLYSADPNRCPGARKYDILCMEDAEILNSANRLGMHRHTIAPLLATRTPLRVRSLANGGSGTLVIPSERRGAKRLSSC